jgi:UPF0176 protein
MTAAQYKIILFYKFFHIENPIAFRDEHRKICQSFNLKGRMLVACEGVNATFEGKSSDIENYKNYLKQSELFRDVVIKESEGIGVGFTKLVVRVRKEIVTLGAGQFDVNNQTADQITAEELDRLFESKEDFVILDLRNEYELDVGRFEKTFDPKLRNFRDLPAKISELQDLKGKKIVAVCTGGIRCEKATCLLKQEGFENLYQLKDGIHAYIKEFPNKHFKGSLFVFDNRMSTPVVETENREIIGCCVYCSAKSESYYSDDSVRPSRKLICCDDCILKHPNLRSCVTIKS